MRAAEFSVRLEFPARNESLRLARLVAASLAADLGFRLDRIDVVRLAIDELVAVLITAADDEVMQLEFEAKGGALVVSGSVPCRLGEPPRPDPISTRLIDGATGEAGFSLAGSEARFHACFHPE